MIKIFKEFTYEKLDSEEAEGLIDIINTDSSSITNFLIFNLNAVNVSIEQLLKNDSVLIQTSAVTGLLEAVFYAKKLVAIINGRRSSIKLTSSEVDSILINAKSIINGVEKIAVLNKEHMLATEPSELFVYLAV